MAEAQQQDGMCAAVVQRCPRAFPADVQSRVCEWLRCGAPSLLLVPTQPFFPNNFFFWVSSAEGTFGGPAFPQPGAAGGKGKRQRTHWPEPSGADFSLGVGGGMYLQGPGMRQRYKPAGSIRQMWRTCVIRGAHPAVRHWSEPTVLVPKKQWMSRYLQFQQLQYIQRVGEYHPQPGISPCSSPDRERPRSAFSTPHALPGSPNINHLATPDRYSSSLHPASNTPCILCNIGSCLGSAMQTSIEPGAAGAQQSRCTT